MRDNIQPPSEPTSRPGPDLQSFEHLDLKHQWNRDPFRPCLLAIRVIWVVFCCLAAMAAVVLALLALDPILFLFVSLPLCGHAVLQLKRWLVPDEAEYWQQQGLRVMADKWLKGEPPEPLPNRHREQVATPENERG